MSLYTDILKNWRDKNYDLCSSKLKNVRAYKFLLLIIDLADT